MDDKKIKSILKKDPYLERHSLVKNILFNRYFPTLKYSEYRESSMWLNIAWNEFEISYNFNSLEYKEEISKDLNLWEMMMLVLLDS